MEVIFKGLPNREDIKKTDSKSPAGLLNVGQKYTVAFRDFVSWNPKFCLKNINGGFSVDWCEVVE